MSLDRNTVKTIAFLARIRVDDGELEPLAAELSGILDWIEQLNAVDTADVAPMTSVADLRLPLRADVVSDGAGAAAILLNAPDAVHGFYTVPKVVE